MDRVNYATIRYQEVVMWKKPGGHHHVKILHKGDKVEVLQGWSFDERTWKDKRYVKVMKDSSDHDIKPEPCIEQEEE